MSINIDWSKYKVKTDPISQILLNNRELITEKIEYSISQNYPLVGAINNLYLVLMASFENTVGYNGHGDEYELARYAHGSANFMKEFYSALVELVMSCYPDPLNDFDGSFAKKPASRKPTCHGASCKCASCAAKRKKKIASAPKKRSTATTRTGRKC